MPNICVTYCTDVCLQSVAPQPAAPTKGDKKSAPNTSGVNASPSKTAQTPSHLYSVTASPITNPHMYNQLGVSIGVVWHLLTQTFSLG